MSSFTDLTIEARSRVSTIAYGEDTNFNFYDVGECIFNDIALLTIYTGSGGTSTTLTDMSFVSKDVGDVYGRTKTMSKVSGTATSWGDLNSVSRSFTNLSGSSRNMTDVAGKTTSFVDRVESSSGLTDIDGSNKSFARVTGSSKNMHDVT